MFFPKQTGAVQWLMWKSSFLEAPCCPASAPLLTFLTRGWSLLLCLQVNHLHLQTELGIEFMPKNKGHWLVKSDSWSLALIACDKRPFLSQKTVKPELGHSTNLLQIYCKRFVVFICKSELHRDREEETKMDREERDIFHPLAQSSEGHSSWRWPSPGLWPGVSHVWQWPEHLCCLPLLY